MVRCLKFSCRCSTLHVSAYMAIFKCVMFYFYIPEGICYNIVLFLWRFIYSVMFTNILKTKHKELYLVTFIRLLCMYAYAIHRDFEFVATKCLYIQALRHNSQDIGNSLYSSAASDWLCSRHLNVVKHGSRARLTRGSTFGMKGETNTNLILCSLFRNRIT
jgi:hypothetical protein